MSERASAGGRGRAAALKEMMLKASQQVPGVPPSTSSYQDRPTRPGEPSTSNFGADLRRQDYGDSLSSSKDRSPQPDSPPSSAFKPPGQSMGRGQALLAKMAALKESRSPVASTAPSVASVTETLKTTSLQEKPSPTQIPYRERSQEVLEPVVKVGKGGRPISATANYLRLNVAKDRGAFEYEVIFDPPQDHKAFAINMLKVHKESLGGSLTFDGRTLYLPMQLPKPITTVTSPHPADGSTITLKIVFRNSRPLGELKHLYNILFKRIMMELKLVDFNRQYFDPKAAHLIPQYKLEIWPGYLTSVDEYQDGLMLCLDALHRVLRTKTALEYIKEVHRTARNDNWVESVSAGLLGQAVMTTYNNKLYIVDEIDATNTPLMTFEYKGSNITLHQYYKQQYGIEVMDLKQPLLISRKKIRIQGQDKPAELTVCLIPELCRLTGMSDEMRSDFRLMKEVAGTTRITPTQRLRAMHKYVDRVNSCPAACKLLADWGLSIAPQTVQVDARVMDPEKILFGNNRSCVSANADWNRDVGNNSVITAVDLESWIILHTRRDQQITQDFVECCMRCGPPMGIKVNRPQQICLQSDKVEEYVAKLNQVIHPGVALVVCVCPSPRDDRYQAIKQVCCKDNPIPSQVINARTISNRDKMRSVVQKILLQMNCKLGGQLWGINVPFKNAMVIGIDTYHSPNSKIGSVAGFVASYNQSLTKWYSLVAFQGHGQEIVDSLRNCFAQSLRFYFNMNGMFPDRIFIYRDGVGDGQLKHVSEYEVPQLQGCFKSVDPDYSPKLAFLIVQKRINTRIFAGRGQDVDNPPPGTVVDNTVTRKYLYDFFLVSQNVRQGTVTPSHYIVVSDDSALSPEQMQKLTYKMCHLYYNWPGTVRVPAPCQYAHKIAYLIGQNVRAPHHNSLADKLFYL